MSTSAASELSHPLRVRNLLANGYEHVESTRSINLNGTNIYAKKTNGSYTRFLMDNLTFAAWIRGESGEALVQVSEMYWGFSNDTEESLKRELEICTEADVATRGMVEAGRVNVTIPATPDFIPLTFIVSDSEAQLAPASMRYKIASFSSNGVEKAYIDNDGNFVKVGEVAPMPPPLELIGAPAVSGRIIDLE